jgi:hypothetical protein
MVFDTVERQYYDGLTSGVHVASITIYLYIFMYTLKGGVMKFQQEKLPLNIGITEFEA